MSRFTHQRRWAAQSRRKRVAPMTENSITPDEAREALTAICLQPGCVLERVNEYDPRKDVFRCEARREVDGKLIEILVRGETVARTVKRAREMASTFGKPLLRPSEVDALLKRKPRGLPDHMKPVLQ